MELPVIIETLPDQRGYAAHLFSPFDLTAEAPTADEAQQRVTELLQLRLQHGVELRAINVPLAAHRPPEPGWLPDDELTREWLEHMRQFRADSDAADRERLLSEDVCKGADT